MEIKTSYEIVLELLVEGTRYNKDFMGKKWVSVDSLWKFWKEFYSPETADCCEESLERFEDILKKELGKKRKENK